METKFKGTLLIVRKLNGRLTVCVVTHAKGVPPPCANFMFKRTSKHRGEFGIAGHFSDAGTLLLSVTRDNWGRGNNCPPELP